ncbi:hypothetical protein [Desulfosarcina ovata]|uniref:Uncharacterized protein n=1 Tax=Desulfosarcina ovata subsp. ovata TaxID=2752305 RepID=A0A5K8ACN2_9BACT|nr:hypothetical protein [Desulfosarcina ovata]BBO89754.1 hypothetical protein DSCOOX_29340 [Desulfosarcina ovata subsp. ovata]
MRLNGQSQSKYAWWGLLTMMLVVTLIPSAALCHTLFIQSSRYQVTEGKQSPLFFCYGHRIPVDDGVRAKKLIWLNTCQEKNLSIPKKLGPIIFIERLDRGGVCNNDGRAL